jgi:hypothetical protein
MESLVSHKTPELPNNRRLALAALLPKRLKLSSLAVFERSEGKPGTKAALT